MHIVTLNFSNEKQRASTFMAAHNQWIKQGFDQGVFLVVGNLHDGNGGAIVAHNITRNDLETMVALDPFVLNEVVEAKIVSFDPKLMQPELYQLLGDEPND